MRFKQWVRNGLSHDGAVRNKTELSRNFGFAVRLTGQALQINPYHLVNGRVPADPDVYTGKPGKRVRLRIINAGGDTAYRVALGGHDMTITHHFGRNA